MTNANWKKKIRKTRLGNVETDVDNLCYILENDPTLNGTVRKNEFTGRIEAVDGLPFKPVTKVWSDQNQALLLRYLAKEYGISRCKDELVNAIEVVSSERSYHPVREYLDSLPKWDGKRRISTMLVDYLGVEDTPYCRTVSERWMASAVARIYEPGFKADSLLLISGRQGIGKSSFFAKLAVKPEWYTDNVGLSMDSKESAELLRGRWIIEISELATLKRSEVESIKAFISRQSDKYRPAYGRFVSSFDRQCVFCATTNEDSFLRDETGNRRFWCLEAKNEPTKSIWDSLSYEVDLLWAEAKALYQVHKNEGGWFNGQGIEALVEEEANRFKEIDPWESLIREWLDRELPDNWYKMTPEDRHDFFDPKADGLHGLSYDDKPIKRMRVCPQEILNECILKPKAQQTSLDVRRVNKIMTNMEGWRKIKPTIFSGYGQCRGYERVDSTNKVHTEDG